MICRGGSCLGGQQLQHGDLATSATCSAATQVKTAHLTPPHHHTTTPPHRSSPASSHPLTSFLRPSKSLPATPKHRSENISPSKSPRERLNQESNVSFAGQAEGWSSRQSFLNIAKCSMDIWRCSLNHFSWQKVTRAVVPFKIMTGLFSRVTMIFQDKSKNIWTQ